MSTRLVLVSLACVQMLAACGRSDLGYDPSRDPAADVRAAIVEAAPQRKRIVLLVGGEWCKWCHVFKHFLDANPAVKSEWDDRFVTVKVNTSEENWNEEFLSAYPEMDGVPYLFVLADNGDLLHAQSTGPLEDDHGYSQERVLEFVRTWSKR